LASKDILVCGTLNLETTFPIAGFPLNYEPVCYRPFEFRRQPSGVGFNIARALSTLGNRVRFASMVGSDFLGTALRQSMAKFGVSDEFILPILDETPQRAVRRSRQRGLPSPRRPGSTGREYSGCRRRTLLLFPSLLLGWRRPDFGLAKSSAIPIIPT